MAELIQDQAEGLRRLLVQDSLRIVTVTSGTTGSGKTAMVINLAAALSRSGKDVLIIDENAGANNVGGMLGLNAHRDLLDVVRRDKTLDEVVTVGPEGIRLLPAGRGMRVLEKLSPNDQTHLIESFRDFARPMDVVLVDAAPVRASRLLSLTASSHEIVVMVLPQPTSITAAYSLIKNISGDHGKQQFRVLVNQVGTEAAAQMIFDNMAKAASRYLEVSLDFMGYVPTDDKLRQSIRSGRPVIQAFPGAASATAFRRVAESLIRLPCREREDKDESKGLEGLIQRLLHSSRSTPINLIAAGPQVNHV